MKAFVVVLIFCISLFAEYQKAKIDMHGGNYENDYKGKAFGSSSMGLSSFLDKNSSKKMKPSKK